MGNKVVAFLRFMFLFFLTNSLGCLSFVQVAICLLSLPYNTNALLGYRSGQENAYIILGENISSQIESQSLSRKMSLACSSGFSLP